MTADDLRRRNLVLGWWHAFDLESAFETLSDGLREQGLDPALPEDELARANALFAELEIDEEDARRHQVGIVARHGNLGLERGPRTIVSVPSQPCPASRTTSPSGCE
jgi:hypothetical protein